MTKKYKKGAPMIIPIFLLLISSSAFAITNWPYVPFDAAMQKNNYPQAIPATKRIADLNGEELYDFFKEIYENINPAVVEHDSKLIIPKIIHQIWLGSPVPESFVALQQSWIEHHVGRGWMYKLWTDADVAQMQLYNQEYYDATDNYGVKSDILRWEIIYAFGGVYVDMDYECLRSLDDLHYTYDFYTALQPLDTFFVQLGAALFGAKPGHPILKHCIETIKNDWHLQGAPKKTGPVHFTKSFYACAGADENKDIAFPALYFYPLGSQEIQENRSGWT